MASGRIPTLRLKATRGDEVLVERDLSEPSISIGRSASALLVLDDASVSDLHAVINVEDDGSVQLLDLGAGTKHKGESISNATLSPGDSFQLGDVTISVQFDEKESTTPTVDVRPEEGEDYVGHGGVEVDALEFVFHRPSSEVSGLDKKAATVLEVNQIWENTVVETKQFERNDSVVIGDAVGLQWFIVGQAVGWVAPAWSGMLRASPPLWSDVRPQWESDFYAASASLPGGADYEIFRATGSGHTARLMSKWTGYGEIDGKRFTLDELVAAGKGTRSGDTTEIPITDDLRLIVVAEGVTYAAHYERPLVKVVATRDIDWSAVGMMTFIAGIFAVMWLIIYTTPPSTGDDIQPLDDRFAQMLLQKPEEPEKDKGKEDANKDAGEGAKAKKEEGKVGKKESKIDKAKGEKRDVNQQALDKQIAENAGVLGAMSDGPMGGAFASGLNANLSAGIGGLIGSNGTQFGSGGLGGRGGGLGGGGTADGLGGMGTRGMGSGSSGFGSGGGSFGPKGKGGVSANTGDPIIMGALDRALIDAVIKRKLSQIKFCYQRELQKNPELAGKVSIKFTIAKDGTVSSASAPTNTMKNAAVDACIIERFKQMQFPEPKGGGIVIVTYPFIFAPE